MGFETELSERLHAETDDAVVDLDQLLTGSVAYGTKLVRRRRVTRIVAGAACVAALGGAFAYAGTLNNPAGGKIPPAATVTATRPEKQVPITPQAALAVLLELLPNSDLAINRRGGFDGMNKVRGIYATADYGTAVLRLEIVKNPVPYSCAAYEAGCKVVRLPDGSKLRLLTASVGGGQGKKDIQQLQANLSREDGFSLDLIAYNNAPAQPAITLAQLQAIATSTRWHPRLDQSFVAKSEHLFRPRLVTEPSVPQSINSPGAN
ncbi:hypothetical protein [Kribbella monticola]|uniref:hypothetical protein n=1 Tax=Kribbella monticola TaxID=2185285 RepID=UPI000DD3C065|nr:hypothetical protein [Kribbella monticola]